MIKLIHLLSFILLALNLQAQSEIELKSDSLIQKLSNEFKIAVNDSKINGYATTGATWSKHVNLKSKKLFLNKYSQKDYLDYSLTFIYFNETDSCLTARKSYLEHYSWKSGALNDSSESTGRPPSFNLITNNTIIIFEVSCEEYEMGDAWSWDKLKALLLAFFGTNESEIIENGCGGSITWTNKKL